MNTTDNQRLYEDGSAELSLLRAARPIVTMMTLMLWAYTFAGIPMPAEVTPEFAGPIRKILNVLSIGYVGALGAVWIGGMFAPKGLRISKVWVVVQLGAAIVLLAFAMFLFSI